MFQAEQEGKRFVFDAFGEKCLIEPKGITPGDEEHSSVLGILISLYALNARPEVCVPAPLKACKEFSDSMPYVGVFTTHTEQLLVTHVDKIKYARWSIMPVTTNMAPTVITAGLA
ncbi:MAG: DUF3786 domain-containing protein [Desulforhopalus sp.]|nr:DUF3786 domain-containing protein [Desulforhopalus sp.]